MKTHDFKLKSGRSIRLRVAPARHNHFDQTQGVSPRSSRCEECLRVGDEWVDLRLCLFCGDVARCDNSKNRHGAKHHDKIGHAIIQSVELGEDVFMEPTT